MTELKFLIASVFFTVFGIRVGYSIGSKMNTEEFEKIVDGTYRVYDMKKAFDGQTGDPIYWVLGGKMSDLKVDGQTLKNVVEPGKITIYSISRKTVENVADDGKPDPDMKHWKLTVRNGKAHLSE